MFWLDGGGSRSWSGRRSILGYLRDEDVSLTYDAAAREVRRHARGSVDVVGDDPFAVLAEHVALDDGDPSVSWVGYFGYAAPAGPAGEHRERRPRRGVDARAGPAVRHPRRRDPSARVAQEPRPRTSRTELRRRRSRRAAAAAARQQLRGQPDLPRVGRLRRRPGRRLPPAAGGEPRAVRRVPAARRRAPAQLQPGAVRHHRPRRVGGDQADQGHHAAGRHGRGRRAAARARWRRTRSTAPRT